MNVACCDEPIDFNRDIRPILSDKCFHCHGPDPSTREADLRLDQEAAAKESVLVPGSLEDSELIHRITTTDPDLQMPPADSHKELKPQQIELLKRWVQEGAAWAGHWAFERPQRPELAEVQDTDRVRNPIDRFVLSRLEKAGLTLSPPADHATLARRVAFDLTGLPPTADQLQRFLQDPSEAAYENLVDELLASDHYGERMAMVWLDAARYADSDGYQVDATRHNWPWRDWVIDAYNANMPFDQFTIEQFAGDLLDHPSAEQILATCFHRNHMHNGEGGRDPEESRVDYVRDRVNTVGTVWLGLTLECAQCHSHKYDPISQSEYYSLNAFFNSIDETGKAGGSAGPFLKYESPHVAAGRKDADQWLKTAQDKLQQVRDVELQKFDDWLQQQRERIGQSDSFQSWRLPVVQQLSTTAANTSLHFNDGRFFASGANARHNDYLLYLTSSLPRLTGLRLTVHPSDAADGRLSRHSDGHFILTNLKVRIRSADGLRERVVEVGDAKASYEAKSSGRVYGPVSTVLDDDPRTGWMTTGSSPTEPKTAAFRFAEPVRMQDGEQLVVELRQRSLRGQSNLQEFTLQLTDEAGPANLALHQTPLEQLAKSKSPDSDLTALLQQQFLADQAAWIDADNAVQRARQRVSQYEAAAKPQSVTVLKQKPEPRKTWLLVRGVWDSHGDEVQPQTPAVLSDKSSTARSRLDLARWLVDGQHPLTARVAVNRYWQMYFGHGLVRTPGDFGTQGEPPTHPELLDWLAVEFVESGWDIKHLQRLIVTSATYRQSSDVSPDLLQRDPENRLLARAGRFRRPSWMIRDAALAASGLLDGRLGGPPVFPYQPVGAWLDATMGRFKYQTSVGADRYRRSIYTFWRRSVGPTGMFDASKRRVCDVRSVRTNTPLQALTLLNDETFIEAAIALAVEAEKKSKQPTEQLNEIFRTITGRSATNAELQILQQQWQAHMSEFTPETAAALLQTGQQTVATETPIPLAALTMVATTLLNLDETITHE